MATSPTQSMYVSRPSSALHPDTRPETRAMANDAKKKAQKLAQIGAMLHKRREPDALSFMQQSLHLDPMSVSAWKTLAHALAQASFPAASRSAFQTAITLAPDDVAAHTGLATVLAQLGWAAAAVDELLWVRRASSDSATAAVMNEPFERLCRRLMPGGRFVAIQSPSRNLAWQDALQATCFRERVLDLSSTPIPALLAAHAGAARPVIRFESLPETVVTEVLADNYCLTEARPPPDTREASTATKEARAAARAFAPAVVQEPLIQLLPTTADGLPIHGAESSLLVEDSKPNLLIVDHDTIDIMSSSFLSRVCAGKAMIEPGATVIPCALELHVALVESEELVRLNSVGADVSGFDLTALNALSHRSRAIRLSELKHTMLTKPTTGLKLRLDAPEPPALSGESEVELRAVHTGVAHAIVVWHTLRLSAVHKISRDPYDENGSSADRQIVHFLWLAAPGEVDWATHRTALNGRKSVASSSANLDAEVATHAALAAEASALKTKQVASDAAEHATASMQVEQEAVTAASAAEAHLANLLRLQGTAEDVREARDAANRAVRTRAEAVKTATMANKAAAGASTASEAAQKFAFDAAEAAVRADRAASKVLALTDSATETEIAFMEEKSLEVSTAAADATTAMEQAGLAAAEADVCVAIDGVNEDGVDEDGVNEDGVHEVGVNEDDVKEDGVKEDGVKEDGFKEDGAKEDGAKEEAHELEGKQKAHELEGKQEAHELEGAGELVSTDGAADDGEVAQFSGGLLQEQQQGKIIADGTPEDHQEATEEAIGVDQSAANDHVESEVTATVEDGTRASGHGTVEPVHVSAGERYTLLVRWHERRLEFQLCSSDRSAATASRSAMDSPERELLARSWPETQSVHNQNFHTSDAGTKLSEYHWPMLNDTARNDAFSSALRKAVARHDPSLVLDIGSGTGKLCQTTRRTPSKC